MSLFVSFFLPFPSLSHQFRSSPKPGPFLYEKHFLLLLLHPSLPLTLPSLAITYFPPSPSARKFPSSPEVTTGSASQIHSEAKIYTHITLVLRLLSRCHLILQLPVPVPVPPLVGSVDSSSSIKKRRFFYFISLFLTVPISPPDLSSQSLLSFPILSPLESSISPSPVPGFTFPLSLAPRLCPPPGRLPAGPAAGARGAPLGPPAPDFLAPPRRSPGFAGEGGPLWRRRQRGWRPRWSGFLHSFSR